MQNIQRLSRSSLKKLNKSKLGSVIQKQSFYSSAVHPVFPIPFVGPMTGFGLGKVGFGPFGVGVGASTGIDSQYEWMRKRKELELNGFDREMELKRVRDIEYENEKLKEKAVNIGKMDWNNYYEWKGKVDPKEWLLPKSWFDVSPSMDSYIGSRVGLGWSQGVETGLGGIGLGRGIETHPYFNHLLSYYGYNPINTITPTTAMKPLPYSYPYPYLYNSPDTFMRKDVKDAMSDILPFTMDRTYTPYIPPYVTPYTHQRLPRDWSGFAEKFVDGAAVSSPSWAWSHDPSVAHLMITRTDVTMLLLCAKNFKGVTFYDIAKTIGRSEMWTTAALMGEFSMRPEEAEKILDFLGIDKKWQSKIMKVLREPTIKAAHPLTKTAHTGGITDPTIQRLFEILKMYGPSLKAVLNEKLGDGNVSAVDVKVDVVTGRDYNYGGSPRVKFVIDAAFEPFISY